MTVSLPQRLSAALITLSPDHPDSVDALRDIYDPSVVFRDPIQETRGLEAFMDVNRRLLSRLRTLDWTVTRAQGDDEVVFLEWTMKAKPKLAPALRVDGVKRATARGGRIVDHRDYWDFGEMMASVLPGGERLVRLARLPFA